ncbi:hypothetical protein CDL12_23205 [Handroanthus impetiginosus]|uniref:Disease resistance N-terminal domain-containing protein n=1 Tax=Handroanthus impetiginosus TaxID=429701 RepID=A0A2G9GG48_9LAMI|nr:hypothetical protein CDL12_23205 [Handroanthus impetiginosus]
MADAAVEFLLNNLKDLLLYHTHLIEDAKSQIEILENDLTMFKAFLEEYSTNKRNKNKALKQLMKEIRDIVYEAEDIIDTYITQTAEDKARSVFTRIFHGPAKLLNVTKKIGDISAKVKHIYNKSRIDFATLQIGSVSCLFSRENAIMVS